MNQHVTVVPDSLEEGFDELEAALRDSMDAMEIPGAVLGVFHRDQLRTVALGVTDLSSQTPVTTETAFRIASLTKVFTATGIASFIDPEHLPVIAPVATWHPSFRLADPDVTSSVTMAQVLSHSGGWIDPPWPESPEDDKTLASYVDELADAPQFFPPGTLFNYSNSAYQLAGHIFATHSKLPYEQAMLERVLAPLELHNTGFYREQFAQHAVASGHTPGEDGLEVRDPWYVHTAIHPTAGLVSTVDDLLRFLQFHAGLIPTEAAPLSEAQRLAMLVPHGPGGSLGPIAADNMGLGWMRTQIGGRQVAMSFGSDAGLAAGMAFAPDDQFGFVMLSNADPGLVVSAQMLIRAIELFLNTTQPEPLAVSLAPEVLERSTGRFVIPDDLTLELSVRGTELWLSAPLDGELTPAFEGPLTMLSATHGWFHLGPMRLQIDLIRDETGTVAWLRFAARLAQRMVL